MRTRRRNTISFETTIAPPRIDSRIEENQWWSDSPYYDAFVEKEIHSAEILSATLREIGSETEAVCKAADALFKALDSLSISCRRLSNDVQKERSTSPGKEPEIGMLQAFGETLEEISGVQRQMFDAIGVQMGYHIMDLSVKQMAMIDDLKKERKEADVETQHFENEICQYLQARNTSSNPFESKHIFYCMQNSTQQRTSQLRSQELRCSKKIRIQEATAELKRFQLIKNIVDFGYKRNLELKQNSGEVLETMQACFQHCLEKVSNVIPCIDKSHEQCSYHQENNAPLWEEGEKILIKNLATLKNAGEVSLPHKVTSEEITESCCNAQMWDMPKFCRPSPQDVLMEGWLYQKCSSLLSSQSSWVKRWFILKPSEIYYMESNTEVRKFENNTFCPKNKVKVSDVALCTVKALPDTRFCFELVDSRNKPIVLQARGQKELQMWLDRIRSAVGSQLAKDDLEIELGPLPKRSYSAEIDLTIEDRKSWNLWDLRNSSISLSKDGSSDPHETDKNEAPMISKVMKANPKCADCCAVSPDWVSLNLGVVVCLECSGVHRSLGCHVSKIRSLKLDTFSHPETKLLLSLRNERANKIWEKEAKPENKAARTQDRKDVEEWIKSKYVKKDFMGKQSCQSAESKEKRSCQLYAAAEKLSVVDGACTALEMPVVQLDNGKRGLVECTELLLQNGAKMVPQSKSKMTQSLRQSRAKTSTYSYRRC